MGDLMSRDWSRWRLGLLYTIIVWVSIVLAAIIAVSLPEPWGVLPALLPAAAILLIGVVAADHWWTRGAVLIAVPPLIFGVYSVIEVLRSTEGTRYHSYAVMFALAGLGYGLALGIVAMALAGLGVIIGQRRGERDAADLVSDAADAFDDA